MVQAGSHEWFHIHGRRRPVVIWPEDATSRFPQFRAPPVVVKPKDDLDKFVDATAEKKKAPPWEPKSAGRKGYVADPGVPPGGGLHPPGPGWGASGAASRVRAPTPLGRLRLGRPRQALGATKCSTLRAAANVAHFK